MSFARLPDEVRQEVGERVPEDPLVLAVPLLELAGQPHGQLDQGQVQERHAQLGAVPHAGPVQPLQLGPV